MGEAQPSIPPGSVMGRYSIVRELGRGGMGTVYEARHVDLGRRVAIKALSRSVAADKDFVERFLREGRLSAQIEHPHVVCVNDVGTQDGVPFLVMEFLEGRTLQALLDDKARLGVEQALDILLPVIAALDVVHRAGLVHRDLKPANVFLCTGPHGKPHPKVLDFGIAKPLHEDHALTKSASLLGTPLYMSPEQIRDPRTADARADVYSVGVLLYECLTGELPFEIGAASLFDVLATIVAGNVVKPRSRVPEIPETLERVMLQAIDKDRTRRFASARELGRALLPFASRATREAWDGAFGAELGLAPTEPPPPRIDPGPQELGSSRSAGSSPLASSLVATARPGHASATTQPRSGRRSASIIVALATVALLGGVAALALRHGTGREESRPAAASAPQPAPWVAVPATSSSVAVSLEQRPASATASGAPAPPPPSKKATRPTPNRPAASSSAHAASSAAPVPPPRPAQSGYVVE